MGYDTKFSGALKLSRALTLPEAAFILEANKNPDTIPTGDRPARSYMQWVPSETLDHIVYDGNEKFYDYVDWMKWLVNYLKGIGITADGEIDWSGDQAGDTGTIVVANSEVTVRDHKTPARGSHKPLTLSGLQAMALDALKAPQ
jgi:hypothetical protein